MRGGRIKDRERDIKLVTVIPSNCEPSWGKMVIIAASRLAKLKTLISKPRVSIARTKLREGRSHSRD